MYEEEECNEDEEGIIVSNATSVAKLVRKNRSVSRLSPLIAIRSPDASTSGKVALFFD